MTFRSLYLYFFFSSGVFATVFQPQPIEQQIMEADGIVVGHYLKSKSIKLEDGSIATQMIFKMNLEYGIQSEFFGMEEIIVHYPGGSVGDEIVKVEGVPEFIPGENVVLMIKNSHHRYWGLNLGFGTFKLVKYGKDKIMVNTLFPDDSKVGQVKYEEFEKSVRTIKGSGLKIVYNLIHIEEKSEKKIDRLPSSEAEGKNRTIASNDEIEENVFSSGISTVWLLMTLAFMGGIFRYLKKKTVK